MDYNDPYYRMVPGWNKVSESSRFRAMVLSKKNAYNLDYYSDRDRKNSNSIVYESFYCALDYYELNYFRNKGEVVEAGDFNDYSLTLSKVISK